MRKLEVAANEAFDVYRELYYEGGVSSVYFWDLDDGHAGVVLLKKSMLPIPAVHRGKRKGLTEAHSRFARFKEFRWLGQYPCL